MRVYPNSPGSNAGLKAYFDFIIAIGNTRFAKENGSLREILKASVDQKLKMIVYNTRDKNVREVEIIPSTSWGGNGLLGVSIKHSSFDKADERVWHVIEVEPGSPAQQAGFKVNEDYVIGSDSILQENDDLYNLIEAHDGKALKLFVHNINTDNCREIICHPNSRWGGKGYLGCEFGHGLLHRIPSGNKMSVDVSDSLTAPLLKHEQPGQQLLHQALFDDRPNQTPPQPPNQQPKPTPLPTPQTFAQLADAQYQTKPSPPPASISPPQSLIPEFELRVL